MAGHIFLYQRGRLDMVGYRMPELSVVAVFFLGSAPGLVPCARTRVSAWSRTPAEMRVSNAQ